MTTLESAPARGHVVELEFPTVCFVVRPGAPNGIDHWRSLLPARALTRAGVRTGVVPLGADLPDLRGDGRWPNVLIQGGGTSTKPGATRRLVKEVCRPNRTLYVVDVADDPTPSQGLPGMHARRQNGPPLSVLLRDQIAAADLVTVATPALRRVVERLNPNVAVLPDLAEPGLVEGETPLDRPRTTTVGVSGGDSHGRDYALLVDAWRQLALDFPLIDFVTVGARDKALAAAVPDGRLHHVAWMPIDRYAGGLRWIDVACCPLAPSRFNCSKSPVKYLDYALTGAAVVASETVYSRVVRDGHTGLIVRDQDGPAGWVRAIARLLRDDELRRRLARGARADVLSSYCHTERSTAERTATYARHWRRIYGDPAS